MFIQLRAAFFSALLLGPLAAHAAVPVPTGTFPGGAKLYTCGGPLRTEEPKAGENALVVEDRAFLRLLLGPQHSFVEIVKKGNGVVRGFGPGVSSQVGAGQAAGELSLLFAEVPEVGDPASRNQRLVTIYLTQEAFNSGAPTFEARMHFVEIVIDLHDSGITEKVYDLACQAGTAQEIEEAAPFRASSQKLWASVKGNHAFVAELEQAARGEGIRTPELAADYVFLREYLPTLGVKELGAATGVAALGLLAGRAGVLSPAFRELLKGVAQRALPSVGGLLGQAGLAGARASAWSSLGRLAFSSLFAGAAILSFVDSSSAQDPEAGGPGYFFTPRGTLDLVTRDEAGFYHQASRDPALVVYLHQLAERLRAERK